MRFIRHNHRHIRAVAATLLVLAIVAAIVFSGLPSARAWLVAAIVAAAVATIGLDL